MKSSVKYENAIPRPLIGVDEMAYTVNRKAGLVLAFRSCSSANLIAVLYFKTPVVLVV